MNRSDVEKQKISVRVAGRSYTLVSSDPPEYVRRVAALADRRLNEMEMATGMPPQQAAVMTCIHLADELLRARDENTELKRRMQQARAEAASPVWSGAGEAAFRAAEEKNGEK